LLELAVMVANKDQEMKTKRYKALANMVLETTISTNPMMRNAANNWRFSRRTEIQPCKITLDHTAVQNHLGLTKTSHGISSCADT
jgi:hypothetical protein